MESNCFDWFWLRCDSQTNYFDKNLVLVAINEKLEGICLCYSAFLVLDDKKIVSNSYPIQ